MVNQNKIFSFTIKRQAKNVFPRDVERTVGSNVIIKALTAFVGRLSLSVSWENGP